MTLKTNALKLLLFLFSAFALLAKETQKKPNILFIFTDDQSHRTVGCYPESPDWVKTTNIDSLAQNGIRFANCYMGSWCMGSRATLLTGHQTYGVKSMRMEGEYPGSSYDAQKCPFWPAVFRKKDTRPPKSENGIPERTTDSVVIGIFRKSGTGPPSPKMQAITSRNN